MAAPSILHDPEKAIIPPALEHQQGYLQLWETGFEKLGRRMLEVDKVSLRPWVSLLTVYASPHSILAPKDLILLDLLPIEWEASEAFLPDH
jgi:hypothetical protein